MGLFGRKKVEAPGPDDFCANCNRRWDHPEKFLGTHRDRKDPKRCISCVGYEERRQEECRIRQEELAAMVAGGLAHGGPYRDKPMHSAEIAKRALEIAAEIMEQS